MIEQVGTSTFMAKMASRLAKKSIYYDKCDEKALELNGLDLRTYHLTLVSKHISRLYEANKSDKLTVDDVDELCVDIAIYMKLIYDDTIEKTAFERDGE